MWKIAFCAIFCYFFVFINSESYEDENDDVIFKKKNVTCGQYLNKTSGSFHLVLPNLPNKTCEWTLEPQNSTRITLFIHYLFLHESDSLRIFEDCESSKNDSLSLIEPLYAQNGSVTIFTAEKSLCIKLSGNDTTYMRKFEGAYTSSQTCSFPFVPDAQIIHSPIFAKNTSESECEYIYNKDPHRRIIPAFTFEEYNFTDSKVTVKGSTLEGSYNSAEPLDFFPSGKDWKVSIHVSMTPTTTEYFRLKISLVDSECSGYLKLNSPDTSYTFKSPPEKLNNGSISTGCRYVFESPDTSMKLGLKLWKFHFSNPLDIVSINDGGSEISIPLLQVTTSNANLTKSQIIRSTKRYMWMEFKPQTYASNFFANFTVHGQGGYFKGNGTLNVIPTVGNDTVFLLEVNQNEVVLLNFTASSFDLPATLSIYDGFDQTNLLATLHGKVWYPVLSKTSKMMIIATNFERGSFSADFKGVTPGCLQMSTFSNENYILSGNCNNTCLWVIPPQDRTGLVLLLNLQYISLGNDDQLNIYKLDKAKTYLGSVHSNVTHIPQLVIPSNIGALVEVNRGPCVEENEDVVVVGHSSYLPVCGKDLTLKASADFQIISPLYPDTYPLLASCKWKINIDKGNFIHLSFHSMKLVHNHCLKITHLSDNTTVLYDGNVLPEDIFLSSNSIVEFDSTDCKTAKVTQHLESSEGFLLNGTVANCGGVLSGQTSGEFNTSNHALCIWKISVPETQDNANNVVNIISYSMNQMDESGNYELHVYDGNSVRDLPIVNDTKSEIWSRTNNLIFVYKRIDQNKSSSVLKFKYATISCNETMQCDNKMCLHPDWRCNGINDCGDFSDERNCASVPVPPPVVVKEYGYSSTTFWVTLTIMLILGIVLGVGVPYAYEKYKSGQYRRFDDLSAIH